MFFEVPPEKRQPSARGCRKLPFEHIAQKSEFRRRVVFLEDYDITHAQELVQGVDVWINTPRRPWEACGTSGMKVLVNGGLNLSERDGWWEEAYAPELGWAIGDDGEYAEGERDAEDAAALYAILEQEVVPEFYARDASGMPRRWLERVRRSMASLSDPCGSWQLKQVTPRSYIRLVAKSLPCIRFLCAVPSAKCVNVVSPSL